MVSAIRQERGEKTRTRLIETAAYLFHRRGYAGVGINEILKLAKAPKGVLYHHFPGGKPELGVAAVVLSAEIFDDQIRAAAEEAKDASEFIVALGELTADDLMRTNFEAGCPLATIALETAPNEASLTAACRAGFEKWIATTADELSGFGLKDARSLAELVLTSLEGALAIARTQRDVGVVLRMSEKLADFAAPVN